MHAGNRKCQEQKRKEVELQAKAYAWCREEGNRVAGKDAGKDRERVGAS